MAFKPLKYCPVCGKLVVKMLNNADEWVLVHMTGYTPICETRS